MIASSGYLADSIEIHTRELQSARTSNQSPSPRGKEFN
jgi:hypothetical protein